MATIARLVAEITTDTAGFNRGIDAASKKLERFSQRATKLGKTLSMQVTAPLTLAGGTAFKTFSGFNEQMRNISALTGLASDQLEILRKQVMDLAPAVGIGPTQLGEALYFIISAGIPASGAMDVLTASAKAAAAGLGDVVTVADVATSAMNAYGAANLSANDAVSVLVATVREGKAEPEELASAMGIVIPTAAQMGVEFHEVGAAMAVMTQSGLSASEAATALNQVLLSILSPSAEAEKTLAEFGLTAGDLQKQLSEQGLLSVLQTLAETFGDNNEAMANVFGNVRALRGFLNITGQDAEKVAGVFDRLAHSSGDLSTAFDVAASDPMFRFSQGLARIKVALVEIGAAMVPVVIPIMEVLSKTLLTVVDALNKLPRPVKSAIVIVLGLAAAIGPALVALGVATAAINALIGALPAITAVLAAVAPFAGILLAIIGAVVLLAIAYKRNWLGIRSLTEKVARALSRAWHRLSAVIERLRERFAPLFRTVRLFTEALRKLGGGHTQRVHKILNQLPTPLAKLLIALSRVISMTKRFVDAWQRKGPAAAFRAFSHDLDKLGRTLGNFLESLGLRRTADAIRDVFRKIGEVIRDVVKLVDDLIHGRWSAVWRDFKRIVGDAGDLVLAAFRAWIGPVRDLFGKLLQVIRDIDWSETIGAVASRGWELLKGLLDGAEDFLQNHLIPWLGEFLSKIPGWVGDASEILYEKGKAVIRSLRDGVRDYWDTYVKGWFEKLKDKIANAVKHPGEALEWLKTIGQDVISGLWGGIQEKWDSDVKPFFENIAQKFDEVIPDDVETALKAVLQPIVNAINTVKDAASDAKDAIESIIAKLGNLVKDVGDVIPDDVRQALTTLLQPIADGLSVLKDAASGAKDAVTEIVDKLGSLLDDLKKFIPSDVQHQLEMLLEPIKKGIEVVTNAASGAKDALEGLWNKLKGLITDVQQAIPSDIESQLRGLLEPIGNGIAVVTDAATSAKDAVTNFAEKIGNLIEDLVKLIPSDVKQKLEALFKPITDAIDTVESAASSAKSTIGEMIDKIAGLPEELRKLIPEGTGETISKILEPISTGFSTVKDAASDVVSAIDGMIGKISGLARAIGDALGDPTLFTNAVKSALKPVGDAISWLIGLFNDPVSGAISVINGFIDMITGLPDALKSAFPADWLDKLKDALDLLKQGLDWVGDLVQGVIDKLTSAKEKLDAVIGAIESAINKVKGWIGLGGGGGGESKQSTTPLAKPEAIPPAISPTLFDPQPTIDAINAAAAKIHEFINEFPQFVTTFRILGQSLGNALKNGLLDAIGPEGENSFGYTIESEVLVPGLDTIDTWLLDYKSDGEDLGGHLRDGFIEEADDIYKLYLPFTFDTKMAQAINERRKSAEDAGKNVGESVVTGIANGITNTMWKATGAVNDVITAISMMDGSNAGWDVGYSIGQGINSGISFWSSAIAATAVAAVNNAVEQAKQALGIQSPSAVFAEIGHNIGEGLVVGMQAMEDRVARVMSNLVAPPQPAPAPAPAHIQITVNGAGDPQAVAQHVVAVLNRQISRRGGI